MYFEIQIEVVSNFFDHLLLWCHDRGEMKSMPSSRINIFLWYPSTIYRVFKFFLISSIYCNGVFEIHKRNYFPTTNHHVSYQIFGKFESDLNDYSMSMRRWIERKKMNFEFVDSGRICVWLNCLKLGGFGRELREENLNFELIEAVTIWERLTINWLAWFRELTIKIDSLSFKSVTEFVLMYWN